MQLLVAARPSPDHRDPWVELELVGAAIAHHAGDPLLGDAGVGISPSRKVSWPDAGTEQPAAKYGN
jgi:hypothetical protein